MELDQVGLCWDGDLIRRNGAWLVRDFRGTRWTEPRAPERTANRLNAYRVLLTRARELTAIWVPRGSAEDPTRDPAVLDAVAEYLLECGATPLDGTPLADASEHPDLEDRCALPSLL